MTTGGGAWNLSVLQVRIGNDPAPVRIIPDLGQYVHGLAQSVLRGQAFLAGVEVTLVIDLDECIFRQVLEELGRGLIGSILRGILVLFLGRLI